VQINNYINPLQNEKTFSLKLYPKSDITIICTQWLANLFTTNSERSPR